jgi:alpha-beta hydrolase superfamily lysophospholipase
MLSKLSLFLVISAVPLMASSAATTTEGCLENRPEAQENISDQHGFVASSDGTRLSFQFWPSAKPIGVVALVLHGIGYESGPYKVVADALNPDGIDVYAVDARGHGLSCGSKGVMPDAPTIAQDITAMLGRIREQHPSAKLFLIGESMGGVFALNYLSHRSNGDIAGLVLIAPAIQVQTAQFLELRNVRLLPYYLFWRNKPVLSLVDNRLDKSSRDPAFVVSRRHDPLALKIVSINYLLGIQRLAKDWKERIAPKIGIPTLILQGEKDPIISPKGTQALYASLGTSDKTLQLYKDVPHTLLWDPETPQILKKVSDWIRKH